MSAFKKNLKTNFTEIKILMLWFLKSLLN